MHFFGIWCNISAAELCRAAQLMAGLSPPDTAHIQTHTAGYLTNKTNNKQYIDTKHCAIMAQHGGERIQISRIHMEPREMARKHRYCKLKLTLAELANDSRTS